MPTTHVLRLGLCGWIPAPVNVACRRCSAGGACSHRLRHSRPWSWAWHWPLRRPGQPVQALHSCAQSLAPSSSWATVCHPWCHGRSFDAAAGITGGQCSGAGSAVPGALLLLLKCDSAPQRCPCCVPYGGLLTHPPTGPALLRPCPCHHAPPACDHPCPAATGEELPLARARPLLHCV